MQTPPTNPLAPGAALTEDESRALDEQRKLRRATDRAYRFVDEHPLAAFGAAFFSGAVLGRVTRDLVGAGDHRVGTAAAGLVGTAARAAIRATAVSLITRRLARALADEEDFHHTTH